MGCGSSATTVGVAQEAPDGEKEKTKLTDHVHVKENGAHESNVHVKGERSKTDTNANVESSTSVNSVPKSVAFEVAFNDQSLLKNPPRRLTLAPLNVVQMTPELLAERQRLAEDKREMELQRKVSASKKSSKRRRELKLAREFEKQQITEQSNMMEEQMKAAESKRAAKLEEIRVRQRIKEQRAKRAREKAKRLNQEEPDDLDLDVEKDTEFNAGSDESWSGGEEVQLFGRKKNLNRKFKPIGSASTVDSYENAFSREPNRVHLHTKNDDFFDS